MPSSYRALCSDFYVNQRLNLKMDLPMRRDTVLSMFDRIRRDLPFMDRFRRYQQELALESSHARGCGCSQAWLAIRQTSIRSGVVNPEDFNMGYRLHRLILETAPYFLDISPIDLDYIELLYGFDLLATGNHDAIVFDALIAGTPLAALASTDADAPINCQPIFGFALNRDCDIQAHFEIKTRTPARSVRTNDYAEQPISVYLTIRKYGPVVDIKELPALFDLLARHGEHLAEHRIVPHLLIPIREAIASGGG